MTKTTGRQNVVNQLAGLMNAAARRMSNLYPGYFQDQKHNHYRDFGWPKAVTFDLLYDMYCRNGLARAAVSKTARKVWETHPKLRMAEEGADETPIEMEIRQRFDDLRVWQRLSEAHRRSLVGKYSGAILRLADSKMFREPVDTVPGGLDGVVEIIPAWEGQLRVSEWDTNEMSETYGHPTMFQFNEAEVGATDQLKTRSFDVHPDRVVIWSEDGTVHDRSFLEPGFNDLMTIEKIVGSGGEGFWKNAKSGLSFELDPNAQLEQMAQAMGVPLSELSDALSEQVDDFNKGLDKSILTQGMKVNNVGVTLPIPEHFFGTAIQCFAASVEIPVKILVGSQSGERASTEDAGEWARTNMGRRNDSVIPNIMALVNRLERFGILPEQDWWLEWSDLTEASMPEKIERAGKMSAINKDAAVSGSPELIFLPEEIRKTVGLEPLSDAESFRDEFRGRDAPPEDE